MANDDRRPFRNNILFCDLIGYSRLDPVLQGQAIGKLNTAARTAVATVDASLERDVVALPTGDGLILNFVDREPDIHLRAAISLLGSLHEQSSDAATPGLRIGLNSGVDTLVTDINGRRNVVGEVINMAQRVMDLGGHAQVLMHDRVRNDLRAYPELADKVHFVGQFTVKHNVALPVAQYRDRSAEFIDDSPPPPPSIQVPGTMDFAQIIRQRSRGDLLRLQLPGNAASALPFVHDHVEEFLDAMDAYQSLRIATAWTVAEMLGNAFEHGRLHADDIVELRLDHGRRGIRIAVEQPDRSDFDLCEALARSERTGSFMSMLAGSGHEWRVAAVDAERIMIEVELPRDGTLPIGANIEALTSTTGPLQAIPLGPKLQFSGRIDQSTAAGVHERILAELAAVGVNAPQLILDLSQVDYVSSVGLRALLLAKRAAGTTQIVVICNPRLREIFAISRYDMVFSLIEA